MSESGQGIAIVGMACRFPGAATLDEFWHNLLHGIESISRLSDEELFQAGVPAEWLGDPRYVKAAPLLHGPDRFDAGFFGISPREARTMDPQQRILLELAHEALEHAGYGGRRPNPVGVFAGAALNTYFTATGLGDRLARDYIPTLIGNDKDFLSTRISYELDLSGPSLTVQTACSTSLVAVHLACQSLLAEETEMALAGAISVRVPHVSGYFCDGGGVVSPDGRVRAFDAGANGTVFGSGGGIVVLRRLADALAAGDTVHAVILGSGVNNDGSAKAGYTAPSVDAQAEAVIEALAHAGIDAASLGYVEAHGSGTPVGDPIELRALTRAFRAHTPRSGYCAIGSVKTNVGHLDAAAGMAGLIKTVLVLEHERVPPSLHFREPNPEIDFPSTPFYVNTSVAPWPGGSPRRAAVVSTGMGGTNATVVLEQAPPATAAEETPGPHLLVLSARSEEALDRATANLRDHLARADGATPADVAFTLQTGRAAFAHRRYAVCDGREDAVAALGDARRAVSGHASAPRRPLLLLLPGVGDHYVGMAHGLYRGWPLFAEEVDRCAEILRPQLDLDIRTLLYPPGESRRRQAEAPRGIDLRAMLGRAGPAVEDPAARALHRTLFAQPALFTIEYATARLWQSLGIEPDAIAGHSMGEYVAACLAGVLSLEDALRLVAVRAKLVDRLPQAAMLAVALAEHELQPLLPGDVSVSLINGPRLCVAVGPPAAVAELERRLDARGAVSRPVQNSHAFHSRMLEPIVEPFEQEVRRVRLREPVLPYISNVSGTWIAPHEATNPAYWARHATSTARWSDALAELWRFEKPVLLEAGPGRTLGVLATQHPGRKDAADPLVVSSIRPAYQNEPDAEFLLHAIGSLWLAGVEIRWDAVPRGGRRRRVALPTYPFERQRHWIDSPRAVEEAPLRPVQVARKPDPRSWIYVPTWKRALSRCADVGDDPPDGTERAWLVYADESGLAARLVSRLEASGHDVIAVRAAGRFERVDSRTFTIDPADPGHHGLLLRTLRERGSIPRRIVHAWSVDDVAPASPFAERFARTQERGFHSLLHVARALAAQGVRHEVDVFVLSSAVQEVTGTEDLRPEKATILGPCLVLRQEYPNLRVRSIDLEVPRDEREREASMDLVLGELLDPDASLSVAHRHARRWVESYDPVRLGARPRHAPPFRRNGVYLITGGLGRIGVALASHLAERYEARLVLVGRSSADPGALEGIASKGGEVLYARADVSDEPGMRAAIEQAERRFGALHGVIHGAGIVGPRAYREIEDADPASCDPHFRAKALGLHVLERVLEDRSLDFCLLLSSLASLLGGIGQSAYAASNLFMDAFARLHNRASSVRWLSVNWDVWRLGGDAGIAAGMGTTLDGLGLSAVEGASLLETLLAVDPSTSQLVVSTGDLEARIDQWVRLASLDSGTPQREMPAPLALRGVRERIERIDAPRGETEQAVARIWQEALGLEAVGIHDSFADLGGHSLLAVRIVSELRKAFRIDLPVRALFDTPTVADLSRSIEERIVAEIDELSDDEAKRLA